MFFILDFFFQKNTNWSAPRGDPLVGEIHLQHAAHVLDVPLVVAVQARQLGGGLRPVTCLHFGHLTPTQRHSALRLWKQQGKNN